MLLKLNLRKLEGVVKEGVKEMLSHFPVSRTVKKSSWYKRIIGASREYEEEMNQEFLPVVVKDFDGSVSVKITRGHIEKGEVEKLVEFQEMVKKSRHGQYEERLKNKVQQICLESERESVIIVEKIEEHHCKIVEKLENVIRESIFVEMSRLTDKKKKLNSRIYNFTSEELPDEVVKLFENGVDCVPAIGMTRSQVKKRVNKSLLEYMERFRNKRRDDIIESDDVKVWLQEATEREGFMDTEGKRFYKRIADGYSGFLQEVALLHNENNLDTEEELKKKLDIEGSVIVNCDKNLGMSVFSLETMRNADKGLMKQLGAKEIDKTKDEVIKDVIEKIDEFEEDLENVQKEYIDYVYNDRDIRKCTLKFPFLKSVHKIQKMSEEEIEQKDLSKLKFRPIIDAKAWATRGYATLSMRMMRKLINQLLEKAGPVMSAMKVKNGWRFAKELQEFEFEEKYGVTISADIEEAYTNITAEMINKAIEVVSEYLENEEWKTRLMKKLIDLVLSNNYVETSTGIYLFKMVLPMGYKLSGEALDIVAISGEMMKMMNIGAVGENIGLPIAEILEYPEELGEVTVAYEMRNARGIKDYRRYVDDSHCIIQGNEVTEIIDGILAVGLMFPSGLVIKIDLNIWRSEFLDVTSWRGLLSGKVSTMMKRNYKVPFGHIKKESDHPEKYKLKSLLGEMLRNRRLASDMEIVERVDKCILEDFVSIGYDVRKVTAKMSEESKKIEENYSYLYVRNDEETGARKFSFGGGIEFNGNYEYNKILSDFIKNCKPDGASNVMSVPGPKLKAITYTKRKYLKKQKDDIEKNKRQKDDMVENK